MVKNLVNSVRRNFTLKFIILFLIIFVFTTTLSTYLFSQFIYKDISSRLKLELVASKRDFLGNLNDRRNLAFHYSQIIAAAEKSYLVPQNSGEEAKSLSTYLIERARLFDFDVDLINVYPGEELTDKMLKKGLIGVVTSSFAMVGKRSRQFSVVAVSPVLAEGKVKKIVRVSYPVAKKYLIDGKKNIGADLSIFFGGTVVASTSTCNECLVCLKKIVSAEKNVDHLQRGNDIYFVDECDPVSHSGVVSKIDIGEEKPIYLFVTREMGGEIQSYRKSTMAYTGGVAAFSTSMILLFVLFARKLTRPIKKLTAMAKEISEGKSGITVEQTSGDEIGDLEKSLNDMSGKLAEAFFQIEKRKKELEKLNAELKEANLEILGWNKNLEERVREKSHELEHIHAKMVEIEKMAAMGQLTAGMAHELNNPLSGIKGYAQYGLEKLESIPPEKMNDEEHEKLKTYLGTIEELSDRCGKIISRLTDFSSDKLYEYEQLNVNELVNASLSFFEEDLQKRGIDVRMELASDLKKIYGSSEGLRQVLDNMIINARDAMPGGGELSLRTRNNNDNVILEVVDSGEGIPRDVINKIFDPFFTTSEVGKGTGLGLYVSYNVIKRHGGDILVKSEEGKGSSFSIVFPSLTYRRKE